MNAREKRPELEEFIRLCSTPASFWGMADVDVVDICNYALRLETALSLARSEERKRTIEECAKVADLTMISVIRREAEVRHTHEKTAAILVEVSGLLASTAKAIRSLPTGAD